MAFNFFIPLVVWVLFFLFLKKRGYDWRTAFLVSSVLWGVSVTLLTELPSLFAALNRPSITAAWTLLAFAGGLLLFRSAPFSKSVTPTLCSLSAIENIIVIAINGILLCTLIVAIFYPPNTWDSLTYHMTRVMFWIQQGSVAHFPTNDLRQIELNPWAEFAIMHFQILTGGDYLANLVQWFSFVGCVVGVSLIANMFNATVRGQILSGLLAATIPMAILQASSTQNDLVVSFWLVCFVAFGIKSKEEKSLVWGALMSCSLGLAVLTKGTAYICALPFLLWFIIADIKLSWRQTALKYLFLGTVVLALNLGHYQRNYNLFHNPLQSGNDNYSNGRLTPGVVVSNLSRNIVLHLLIPSDKGNGVLISTLNSFHNAIGIAVDDADTTWPGATPKILNFSIHEDNSGNFIHLLLFVVVSALLVLNRRFRSIIPYTLAVMAASLLFCIMLRWQLWNNRLHLPLFVLFSPVAGFVISMIRNRWITYCLFFLFSLASLPYILFNKSRPVIVSPQQYQLAMFSTPRWALYFTNRPERGPVTLAAVDSIRNGRFRNIGLISGGNSWEYPLWALTREDGVKGPRIEHLDVQNISRTILQRPFSPDIIVVIHENGYVQLRMPQNSTMSQ